MQSGHINGVPCLQCIDSILREEYSDNGDLVAYVVDVSVKVSVLRSGELRSYLQLSLIDESSIDRPLVHQIWGDIVRKLQRIVVKGCIVCIYNYSRVRVYGGALMIRDGTIEVVELFNSCPINTEIFPLVVRRRVSNILLWLGGTIYRSCISSAADIKSVEVKCLEAAKSEYLVTMPILVYDRDVQCIPDVSPHLLVVYCANRSSDLSDKTKLRPMPMEISKQHISQIVELLSSESTEGEVKTVALDYNDYFRCALCIGVWLQASGVCIASVYQKKVTLLRASGGAHFRVLHSDSTPHKIISSPNQMEVPFIVDGNRAFTPTMIDWLELATMVHECRVSPDSGCFVIPAILIDCSLFSFREGSCLDMVYVDHKPLRRSHDLSRGRGGEVDTGDPQASYRPVTLLFGDPQSSVAPFHCVALDQMVTSLFLGVEAAMLLMEVISGESSTRITAAARAVVRGLERASRNKDVFNVTFKVCPVLDENEVPMAQQVLLLEALEPVHRHNKT